MVTDNSSPQLSRRSFLVQASQIVAGLATLSVPELCEAKVEKKRTLSLYHTRTQQELNLTYAVGKKYNPKALSQVNSFLRDYQTGQVHKIDPKLLDILWAIQQKMGSKGVYKVVSAYRSPQTNRQLQRTHDGVAGHSLHMLGRAIDIRFSGAKTSQIKQCALAMRTGGVGYYAESDFVHLDSGEFRTW